VREDQQYTQTAVFSACIQQDAGLSILMHRARALCNRDTLHGALKFLKVIFRQIYRIFNPSLKAAPPNNKLD
jgi:hypothetical protein